MHATRWQYRTGRRQIDRVAYRTTCGRPLPSPLVRYQVLAPYTLGTGQRGCTKTSRKSSLRVRAVLTFQGFPCMFRLAYPGSKYAMSAPHIAQQACILGGIRHISTGHRTASAYLETGTLWQYWISNTTIRCVNTGLSIPDSYISTGHRIASASAVSRTRYVSTGHRIAST
eukprot:3940917-Rhodomonas_salina.2